jgi:hypothetical protein
MPVEPPVGWRTVTVVTAQPEVVVNRSGNAVPRPRHPPDFDSQPQVSIATSSCRISATGRVSQQLPLRFKKLEELCAVLGVHPFRFFRKRWAPQCNIVTSESMTWIGSGGVYGWVDMRRFDSFLKRGCVVPGASFVAKLHSPATETNRPKLLALTGQILNLYGHDQTPGEEQSEVNFSRLDANNPKLMDQVIQVSK